MNKKWLLEETCDQPWVHTQSTLTITGILQALWCYNQKKPRWLQDAAIGSDMPEWQIPPLPHITESNAIVKINLLTVKFPFCHATFIPATCHTMDLALYKVYQLPTSLASHMSEGIWHPAIIAVGCSYPDLSAALLEEAHMVYTARMEEMM